MNIRLIPTAVLLAGALAAPSLFAAERTAAIDLSTLKFSAKDVAETVEVNLDSAVLAIAARLTQAKDAEAAQVIRGLQQVQVRVLKVAESSADDVRQQMNSLRARLDQLGWKRTVSVHDAKGADVGVHVNIGGDETIEGLVVTVLGDKDEAVFVNITGQIRADDLAKLGARLNIDPLKNLPLAAPQAPAAPAAAPAAAEVKS